MIEMDGLMWFDNSDVSLEEKVSRAAQAYEDKFGRVPEVCFVSPQDFENVDADLMVVQLHNIPSCHFWVGVEES